MGGPEWRACGQAMERCGGQSAYIKMNKKEDSGGEIRGGTGRHAAI